MLDSLPMRTCGDGLPGRRSVRLRSAGQCHGQRAAWWTTRAGSSPRSWRWLARRRWRRTASEEARVSSTAWRTSSCRNQTCEASPVMIPRCSAATRLASQSPHEELDQPSLDADRHDGDGPDDLDVLGSKLAEATDDSVLDAAGQVAGGRGDQLGHEQRVAAAGVEHLRGVSPRIEGEEGDRVHAERPEAEVGHVRPADRAQQLPHRVAEPDVLVPVGDDDHEGQVAHARR